jgi:hypothetical protein
MEVEVIASKVILKFTTTMYIGVTVLNGNSEMECN